MYFLACFFESLHRYKFLIIDLKIVCQHDLVGTLLQQDEMVIYTITACAGFCIYGYFMKINTSVRYILIFCKAG